MSQLKVMLLGSPQIELDGQAVETDRRKAVALLAYLLVTAVPHTRETLATLFWPESDQSRALAYLRRAVWELNHILGDGWLVVERERIGIQPEAELCMSGKQDIADFFVLFHV